MARLVSRPSQDTTAVAVAEPRLSRARFFPNTNIVHGNVANGRVDVADNVLDLQVALAVDVNLDGAIAPGPPDALDEWLWNDPNDAGDTDSLWGGPDVDPTWILGTLFENTRAIGFFERMGFERHGAPILAPGMRTPSGGRHHLQLMVRSSGDG